MGSDNMTDNTSDLISITARAARRLRRDRVCRENIPYHHALPHRRGPFPRYDKNRRYKTRGAGYPALDDHFHCLPVGGARYHSLISWVVN